MAAQGWMASGGRDWLLLALVVLLIMVFFTLRSSQLRRRVRSASEEWTRREERRWRSYGRPPGSRPAASALPRGVSPTLEAQKQQLEELWRKGRIDRATFQRVLEKLERQPMGRE
ncbi:MAG: hypothetical protein K6T75_08335 [Acetobacteraceae bacterium]|nr:hypothetical protein [Acetobacteraceae bacterium]